MATLYENENGIAFNLPYTELTPGGNRMERFAQEQIDDASDAIAELMHEVSANPGDAEGACNIEYVVDALKLFHTQLGKNILAFESHGARKAIESIEAYDQQGW